MRVIVTAGVAAVVGLGVLWGMYPQNPAEAQTLFPYTDPASVAAGEALYQTYCASCHMADLSGEPDWRSPKPSGRMPAPPHDETGHTWHHSDAQLFMLTKYGTAALVGNGYQSDMMGFQNALSDEEIMQVLAFIKSTWPEHIVERHNEMNAASNG